MCGAQEWWISTGQGVCWGM